MDQELVLEKRTSGSGIAPADGQPGVWTETGHLNTPREAHTATLLQNGMVLAHGGRWRSDVNGVFTDHGYLSSAELFNPATGKWTLAPSAFYERFAHTATLLPNGKVLVVGGNPTTNTELFDPVRGQWFATGRLNTPRVSGHAATALADGRVLVFGGETDPAIPSFTASAEIYDPTTQAWTPTGSLGHVRYGASATLLLDGRVLVVGGANTQLAELYDPATGQWHFTAGPLHSGGTTTLLKDGRVLFSGGDPRPHRVSSSPTVELFDPAQLTWRLVGLLNVGRLAHTATLLSNGKVLAVGGLGRTDTHLVLQSAELFDPATLKWTLTAPPNTARSGPTATLLRRDRFGQDRVLIAGGDDGPSLDNSLDSTELCLLGAIVTGPPLPPPSARTKSMQ
jgi:N-acetylneuraminic acid mutarotase